uniref:Phytanoyl-CoA dioxygenase n=1 Tax=Rheinheimera sp. BAL341 TaxID=1708203 RepID=A0A486XLQ1_9GAMM
MNYAKQLLSPDELNILSQNVKNNYLSTGVKNQIVLDKLGSIVPKLTSHISDVVGEEVEFLNLNFIFLACNTTMAPLLNSESLGWHTDNTCSVIDGNCYNAWVPLFNDSTETGIEVIADGHNKELFSRLGDPTFPLKVYCKKTSPSVFKLFPQLAGTDYDMVFVKPYTGTIVPFRARDLEISKSERPEAGDVAIFKQTDVHRGFHSNGIRIQLSMKFASKNARLNTAPSNSYYQLFKSFQLALGQSNSNNLSNIANFYRFLELVTPREILSKHGRLEQDLIQSLLSR